MADNESVRSPEALKQAALSPRAQKVLGNQQTFINHVEGLRKHDVMSLPDLVPFLPNDDTYSPIVDELFDHTGNRIYLADHFFEQHDLDHAPDRVNFNVQNILLMGREDSRRGVFFGALQTLWFQGADKFGQQVAVTPIRANEFTRRMALHEVGRYQQLKQLGIATLDLVGVTLLNEPQNDIAGFFITDLVPDLMTLATLEWDKMTRTDQARYKDLALDMVATIHSELIFHGDTEFKNVPFREAQGDFLISDMEDTRSLRDTPDNISLMAKRMETDLERLEKSVGHFILQTWPLSERPTHGVERFNFMHNYVYEPYFERIIGINGPYVDALTKAYDFVINDLSVKAGATKTFARA